MPINVNGNEINSIGVKLLNDTGVVTSGLVLYIDPGIATSYGGSGTSVYDLSGNGKTGTLTNTPTFATGSPAAHFTGFDSNQYIVGSNGYSATSIPTGTSARTVMAGFRTPSTLTGYQHILHYGENNVDKAYGMAIYENKLNNHTWGGNSNYTDSNMVASTDYIAAVTYDNAASPRNIFFVNGTFGTTGYGQGKTADYALNTGTTYDVHLGSRIQPAEQLGSGGRIYFALIYNRKLTDAEIRQNFNLYRQRIGI